MPGKGTAGYGNQSRHETHTFRANGSIGTALDTESAGHMALIHAMDVVNEQHSQPPTRTAAQPVTMTPIWNEKTRPEEKADNKLHERRPQEQEAEEEQDHQEQEQQHSPIRRVDTPCPAALRQHHMQIGGKTRSLSLVLMPDGTEPGTRRRFIPLDAGRTTVVGRSKSSGIRDHHVSRRHVEISVPNEREQVSTEECCRIKYIGRNCRVVLVGGILLKAEQEVPAVPGTRVILNFNNKGLPRYSYTVVPANNLPAPMTSIATRRRSSGTGAAAAAGRGASTSRRWRGDSIVSSFRPTSGDCGGGDGGSEGIGSGIAQQLHDAPPPQAFDHLHRYPRHSALVARQRQQQRQRPAGGRFRKETQEKLQKERDEIFSRFADLKFV